MAAPSRPSSLSGRPAWLDSDRFPFQSRFLEVGGCRLHYLDEGSGPALLMVSAGFWAFMFRDLVLRLRDDFRCLVLDFPGSGLSARRPGESADDSIVANAAVLDEFVAGLDLQDVTLLLHDVGGPVGFLFAVQHPERCRALVIANTFAWPLREYRFVRGMLALIGTPLFGLLNTNLNLLARVTASRLGAGRHFDRGDRAVFSAPWRTRAARRTSQGVLAGAGRADPLLARLERELPARLGDLPVLTLFGRRNDGFGWQARFGSLFQNVTPRAIEDGNHFPFCDDPDRFAAELRGWWRREVAGRPPDR